MNSFYPFVTHLNVQTNCNLSFSLINIDDLIKFSLENKIKKLSISDYYPYDFLKFYYLCKSKKIKPIFGIKKIVRFNDKKIVVNFFPKNYFGYRNLNQFFYKNIEKEEVEITFLKNSIVKCDCLLILEANKNSDFELLILLINEINNFSSDQNESIYIGLNFFPKKIDEIFEKINLKNLLPFFSIKVIKDEDVEFLEDLKKTVFSSNFFKEDVMPRVISYLKKNDLIDYIEYNLEEKENEKRLIDFYNTIFFQLENFEKKINIVIRKFFNKKKELENFSTLERKCKERLENLSDDINFEKEKYRSILYDELEVIKKLNFSEYFLNVENIINILNKKNIEIGPGRGSSVSSLVCFLLNITQIDPIKNNLFFWRFINEKRNDYPDIDIDIDDQKKTFCEIRDYYGKNFVSKIIIRKKVGWINAFRIFSKLFEIDKNDLILFEENWEELEKKNNNPSLIIKILREKYEYLIEKVDILSNLNYMTLIHPSGLIFSRKKLINYLPLKLEDGFLVCLYRNEYLNNLNFKKIDFLNLPESLLFIKNFKKKGIKIPSYGNLLVDNKLTLEFLNRRIVSNIFQIDSFFFKKIISKFKITNFFDIILLISLNRPGTSFNIDEILENRNKSEKFLKEKYFYSQNIYDVLKETYGIIIFEEQITQILSICLNLDFSECELIRKKLNFITKDKEKYKKIKEYFFKNSHLSYNSNYFIWEKIVKSIPYIFNKAHATAYAYLTYYISFLKANFFSISIEYLLNKKNINNEKYSLIEESVSLGFNVINPNINNFSFDWKINIEKKNIYIGVSQLNFLYNSFFNEILIERNKNGDFKNWRDFLYRNYLPLKKLNLINFVNLIEMGFFMIFDYDVKWLIFNINFMMRYIKIRELISFSEDKIPFLINKKNIIWKEEENFFNKKNEKEFELFGFYISYRERWIIEYTNNQVEKISNFIYNDNFFIEPLYTKIKIYLVIKKIKKIKDFFLIIAQDFDMTIEFFLNEKFYYDNMDKIFVHNELFFNALLKRSFFSDYSLFIKNIG